MKTVLNIGQQPFRVAIGWRSVISCDFVDQLLVRSKTIHELHEEARKDAGSNKRVTHVGIRLWSAAA